MEAHLIGQSASSLNLYSIWYLPKVPAPHRTPPIHPDRWRGGSPSQLDCLSLNLLQFFGSYINSANGRLRLGVRYSNKKV